MKVKNYPIVPLNLFGKDLENGEASSIAYHTGQSEESVFYYLMGSEPTEGSNMEITDYNIDNHLLSGNFSFEYEGPDSYGVVNKKMSCTGSFNKLNYSEYTP